MIGFLEGLAPGPLPASRAIAGHEFPWTLPDGEDAGSRVVDHAGPRFSGSLAPGGWQEGKTVPGAASGNRLSHRLGNGGEDIGVTGDARDLPARLDAAFFPPDEEGDPVPTLPDVGLGSAPVMVGGVIGGAVALVLLVSEVMVLPVLAPVHERPVVAGVDHEGVVALARVLDGLEDHAHRVVDLVDEVAIGSQLRLSNETLMGPDRFVGTGEGQVEEVGFAGCRVLFVRGGGLPDEGGRFRGEIIQDVAGVEVGVPGPSADILRKANGFLGGATPGHRLVIAQVDVGDHVEGGRDAEPLFEALLDRSIGEGFVEDHLSLPIAGPFDTEVPFAHHGGLVAVGLEVAGDGGAVVLDEGFVAGREKDSTLQSGAPAIAASEQAVAGGSADRGATVGIEKGGAGA